MLRRRRSSGTNTGHDAGGMMRWLLTYADLITLLMVFFVVMYAMSATDKKKFNALKSSLQIALRQDGAGTNPIMDFSGDKQISQNEILDSIENIERENQEFQEIIAQIKAGLDDATKAGFYIDERGLTIRFLDNVLFDLGEAELKENSLKMLDSVGVALNGKHNYIRVEGHADDLPINTLQFPSNWELSASRSIAVTRYLIERHKMDPQRLSSLGYGEYQPLYPNINEANRSRNRRVDIVILRSGKSGGEIDTTSPDQHKNVEPQ